MFSQSCTWLICTAGSTWAHWYSNVEVTCRGCYFSYGIINHTFLLLCNICCRSLPVPEAIQSLYYWTLVHAISHEYQTLHEIFCGFSPTLFRCKNITSLLQVWYKLILLPSRPAIFLFISVYFKFSIPLHHRGHPWFFKIIGEIHPLHPKSQILQNMQQLWHILLRGVEK